MATVGLVRPDSKAIQYQNLATVSAVEPPHWMMVRAAQLEMEGAEVKVHDCAINGATIGISDCDRYEVWPSGVHPSAFVQEQAGVEHVVEQLRGTGKHIDVMEHLPFNPIGILPAYCTMDAYKAHNWHSWGQGDTRPYGTVSFAISCPYTCRFCTVKQFYRKPYTRQPLSNIMAQLVNLKSRGVRNVKVMDEIAVLPTPEFRDIVWAIEGEFGDYFNFWCYSRADTLPGDDTLIMMKQAGFNWVCVGIESGVQAIRESNGKGSFTNGDVEICVQRLQGAGIHVLGNFMFGFPEDDRDALNRTFELSWTLGCEYTNYYCMVPYPNTKIRALAVERGWDVACTPQEFAQMGYEFKPLQTEFLSSAEVLAYRDWAWSIYHNREGYWDRIGHVFGEQAREEIKNTSRIEIKRKVLDGGTWMDFWKT
uniref:Putative radical SAM superfamily protein n=1 Tax=viral metagenome TaxID=1070528 RepID=A0A6M3KX86_9ZZZZ